MRFLTGHQNFRYDYLAFYDSVFTTSDITQHYNAGKYGFGYTARIHGTVYNALQAPISSNTRLYNSNTGAFVTEQQNDPVTGEFTLLSTNFDDYYVQQIPDNITERTTMHGPIKPEVV